ncbi:MAG: YjjG family noncanonical pyrimidine nucleotidase [bacterium]|nr:YjjG family noncanonical pyrimidine nucleotidase [bacterium]MCM1376303.1 YjjG family noncanonical pyrimidine nucleotidase [Muribaculum sp.]
MRSRQMFTTLLWDVDGTLLDFDYSMRRSLQRCFRSIGQPITEEMIQRYSQINDGYWRRLERGEITRAELLVGRFRDFFAEYGLAMDDEKAFLDEFQKGLGHYYAFMDDSLTVVKALQDQYRQYVVTNGVAATQMSKLKLSGLFEVMDGIFISEEVGCGKPSLDFFNYCLERLAEKDRDRILIIGDSMTSDILGGLRAGIRTCWYNPDEKPQLYDYKADYEIAVLQQLYEVLGIYR